MSIKQRSIFALWTLALCAPLAFAQDAPQGQQTSPPPQQGQGQSAPDRGLGPSGQMGRGGMRGGAPMLYDDGGEMMDGMRRPMRDGMGRRQRMWARNGMGRGMGFGGRDDFGGPGAMGRFGGPMPLARIVNNPDMREKLGITSEQAAKIRQQDADFQKAGIMNRAKLQVAHLELNQLMSADKPDRAAIDKKLSEISVAQLAAEQTRVHHQLDMKTALTPDQQAKLKELMQSRRPSMRGPGGPQGGPGRGGRGRPQPPQGTGTPTSPDPADGTKP